jgi:hypothetical protein
VRLVRRRTRTVGLHGLDCGGHVSALTRRVRWKRHRWGGSLEADGAARAIAGRRSLQAKAREAPVCLPPARCFVQRGRAGLQGECFGLDRAATQRPGLAQKPERGRAVGLDEIVAPPPYRRSSSPPVASPSRVRPSPAVDGIPYLDSTDPVALVRGLAGAGPAPDPSNPEVSWPLLDVWTGPSLPRCLGRRWRRRRAAVADPEQHPRHERR